LREFAPEELRRQISAMFQEPVRYHATVAENIAFSSGTGVSPVRASGATEKTGETPVPLRVEAAAVAAGADAIAQRLGYDRQLGREFEGGAELSAGEWQRLALALAFAR